MFTLKKKLHAVLLCSAISWISIAQEVPANYNFETFDANGPVGWSIDGERVFIPVQDFKNFKEGKASLRLEMADTDGVTPMFAVTKVLPSYKGETLVLSGYIKTKGEGYLLATPIIRVDPMLDFVQLPKQITGTTNWKKYELTVELKPKQTQQIIIGAYILGKGTVWMDDFKVTIDGKEVAKAEIFKFPANEDKAFDNGSSLVFPTLDANQIDNLALLGRVWGFLKYHHPAIPRELSLIFAITLRLLCLLPWEVIL
ncbi:hypothetical protein [Myroides fluvii]|uniref:hypothetical protein n=1 Tax=Myroides fluvii TaxID=2572594 RepID=UPI001E63E381|nr:hypothetical protein [Myroides fluvii]